MNCFDEAVCFAVKAHEGMTRKGGTIPYIVHPLEVAAIAAGFTDDPEVLAAAVLHDVVEDTGCSIGDIQKTFGKGVAALVMSDSENKRADQPAAHTWKIRKQEVLAYLQTASKEEKIVVFSDKLSNLRALHRDYLTVWESVWERFNQKDPREQLWYYGSFLDICREFQDVPAYREYERLFSEIRSRVQEYEDYGRHGSQWMVVSTPESGLWVLKNAMTGELCSFTQEEFSALIGETPDL